MWASWPNGEVGNAFGRIRENRLITAWVHRALHWRLASYRYALERLVISVPSVLRRRGRARADALSGDRACRPTRRWRAAQASNSQAVAAAPIVTK